MKFLSNNIKTATLCICAVTVLGLFSATPIEAQTTMNTTGRSNVQKTEAGAVESNKRWGPSYAENDPTLIYGVPYRTVEVELRWGPSYDNESTRIYPAIVPTAAPKKWGPSYAEDDPALIGINVPTSANTNR